MRALLLCALACAVHAPLARAEKVDDRQLVYVDDVVAEPALAADAAAFTTALCAALGQDKRLDVLCAPDVKQILSFAATAAMIGTAPSTGPVAALQERLDRTKTVVSARLTKAGAAYAIVVKAGPKAADAQATALYSDQPTVALEERGDSPRKVLDRLPAIAARISAVLHPATGAPPAPAPLGPPKAAAPRGGW